MKKQNDRVDNFLLCIYNICVCKIKNAKVHFFGVHYTIKVSLITLVIPLEMEKLMKFYSKNHLKKNVFFFKICPRQAKLCKIFTFIFGKNLLGEVNFQFFLNNFKKKLS